MKLHVGSGTLDSALLMSKKDSQLEELLADWAIGRSEGREPSIEQLCSDYPQLADELIESIKLLKQTDWLFEKPESQQKSES